MWNVAEGTVLTRFTARVITWEISSICSYCKLFTF